MARAERTSFEGVGIQSMGMIHGALDASPIKSMGLSADSKPSISITSPSPGFNPGMGA